MKGDFFMAKKWLDYEVEELKKMKDKGVPHKEIAKYFNVTLSSVENKIRRLGISKKLCGNLNFFENINTEEKAYWLGFIYADGYVICNPSSGNYELGIELNSIDIGHLYKFNSVFDNYYKVTSKAKDKKCLERLNGKKQDGILNMCTIRVYSKKIVFDLIRNGVVQNKTNSHIFPKIENEDLFFHFLRGYIDGDGSYTYSKVKTSSGRVIAYPRVNITGNNKECFEYISNRLKSYHILSSINKDGNNYKLEIRNRNSVREIIYRLFNNHSICLDRKLKKVNEFINSRLI